MLCQILVLAGKRFWFNFGPNMYLLLRVQYGCDVVSVFGSGGKKALIYIGMYYLEYNTVVVLCYFLVLEGNSFCVT